MRRLHLAFACVLVAAATTTASGSSGTTERVPSVRPVHEIARRLIEDGRSRSATFRHLLDRLERSDIIVYIDVRPDMPDGLGGLMRFVGATTTHRLVRIRINGRHNWATMVALLGHELQHAVEMAEAPSVRDERGMRRYYEREGIRLAQGRYDSEAAQDTGRAVRFEFGTSRHDLSLARAEQDAEERLLTAGSIGADLMP